MNKRTKRKENMNFNANSNARLAFATSVTFAAVFASFGVLREFCAGWS